MAAFLIFMMSGIIMKFGIVAAIIPALFMAAVWVVFRWDAEMGERFPRWLGGIDSSAPPSILDTDAQAIVREAKQKVTKTDDDKDRL